MNSGHPKLDRSFRCRECDAFATLSSRVYKFPKKEEEKSYKLQQRFLMMSQLRVVTVKRTVVR